MTDRIDQVIEKAACDHWWVPDHTQVVARPEIDYTHSTHPGFRFNEVVRVQPGLPDYDRLVDEVVRAHQGRNSEWKLGSLSYSSQLGDAILRAGYSVKAVCDAWSIDTRGARPPIPDHIRVSRVEDLDSLRDMETVMASAFDGFDAPSDDDLREALSSAVGPDARCRRYVAYDARNGDPLSTGAVNVFPELGFGFMWGGSTIESARGRGVYSALVTARMADAQRLGIERIGLYAMRETSAPIVKAQNFEKHGPVHFLEKAL